MKCPICGANAKQVDSEYPYQGTYELRKRRHQCYECGFRFNTYQNYENSFEYYRKTLNK